MNSFDELNEKINQVAQALAKQNNRFFGTEILRTWIVTDYLYKKFGRDEMIRRMNMLDTDEGYAELLKMRVDQERATDVHGDTVPGN